LLGLTRLARLLEADRPLLLDGGRRDLLDREVLWAHRRDLQRDLAREGLERVAAADEVGLAIHLEEDADAVVRVNVGGRHALGGDAPRLLGGGGEPLLAQEFARLLHVALDFDEGLLAVSHPRAGALAELLDHAGSDFGHDVLLQLWEFYF